MRTDAVAVLVFLVAIAASLGIACTPAPQNAPLKGVYIYTIVFLMLVPWLLNNYFPSVLMLYVCNVDIVANVLGSADTTSIFSKLYVSSPDDFASGIPYNVVSLISLVGISHAVISVAVSRGANVALFVAALMLASTFLAPGLIIPLLLRDGVIDEWLPGHESARRNGAKHVCGFVVGLVLILFECLVLFHPKGPFVLRPHPFQKPEWVGDRRHRAACIMMNGLVFCATVLSIGALSEYASRRNFNDSKVVEHLLYTNSSFRKKRKSHLRVSRNGYPDH